MKLNPIEYFKLVLTIACLGGFARLSYDIIEAFKKASLKDRRNSIIIAFVALPGNVIGGCLVGFWLHESDRGNFGKIGLTIFTSIFARDIIAWVISIIPPLKRVALAAIANLVNAKTQKNDTERDN